MTPRRPWSRAAFALALLVTLLLGGRTIYKVVYWSDPGHRDQAIEPWMTPRYIVQSYDLPSEVMKTVLQSSSSDWRGESLDDIARARGMSTDALIRDIYFAIEVHRNSVK